jgi:hypothetical protein
MFLTLEIPFKTGFTVLPSHLQLPNLHGGKAESQSIGEFRVWKLSSVWALLTSLGFQGENLLAL